MEWGEDKEQERRKLEKFGDNRRRVGLRALEIRRKGFMGWRPEMHRMDMGE